VSRLPDVTECPVHHGYEPFVQKNPLPAYAALRAEEPVMYDERIGYWVVTRYDDVKAVFDDWATFSSENAQAPVRERGAEAKRIMDEGGFTAYSGLSARVPPEHTRIRKIVTRAFSPRAAEAMRDAQTAELAPGDAIFIPHMWWHHVRSLDPLSILVNYWWDEAQEPQPGLAPINALVHALLSFEGLPPQQRSAWQAMFDHFVFRADGDPNGHVPEERRGIRGKLTADSKARLRRTLAQMLGR